MDTRPDRLSRRSNRTAVGRRTSELRGTIARQIADLRSDAGLSQRRLATAAGIPQSHLSRIEHGGVEPSLAVLVVIADVLGARVSVRLSPGTGPRIRDHLQARIVDALVQLSRTSWRTAVEVPVWRPARGVIDLVLARPGVVVAVEVHTEIRRLEQQLRWASEKAESLPSSATWSLLSGGGDRVAVSRLLVLRSTKSTRELARLLPATFRAVYPASSAAAFAALTQPHRSWPGSAVLWAQVDGGSVTVLERPPRGIVVGGA